MKRLILITLLLMLLCNLCACGRHEVVAPAETDTVEQTITEQTANKLGIIFCGTNDIPADDELFNVCVQAGISSDDFDATVVYFCNNQEDVHSCSILCMDLECTDLLFVIYSDEYIPVIDEIQDNIADIGIHTVSLCVPDPYDMLSMKQSYIDSLDALGGYIYLSKNEKYYSLGIYIGKDKTTEYQIGLDTNTVDFQNRAYSCAHGRLQGIGNIPVPTIEKDDLVVGYGTTFLALSPIEKKGYSIRRELLVDPEYMCLLIPSPETKVIIDMRQVKQFKITDSQGNDVPIVEEHGWYDYSHPDFDNLIENEAYTVSWFEGTTYHEYTMVADSPYYEDVKGDGYTLEGELHKEGYASFDLSGIPSGLYRTNLNGLIQIN